MTPPVPIGCSSPAGPRPAAWTPWTFRRAPGVGGVCREVTCQAGAIAERGLGPSRSRRAGCSSPVTALWSRKEPKALCWLLLLLLFYPSVCFLHEHPAPVLQLRVRSFCPRRLEGNLDNPWRFSPWRQVRKDCSCILFFFSIEIKFYIYI